MPQLEADAVNLVGDSLIASCSIAYLGPFTREFRESLLKGWHRTLAECELAFTPKADLVTLCGDPVQVCYSAIPVFLSVVACLL